MDQIPVVSERKFDGGEKLIRALVAQGFPLTAACWAKTPEYGKGYLYLVTPEVEGADSRPSYARVRGAINDIESAGRWQGLERIDSFDVMLVGPGSEVGKALAWEYGHYPGPGPTIKYGWLGGDIALGETAAYIYEPELFAQPTPAAAG